MARIGGETPAPARYQTPAEELYEATLDAFEGSDMFARMALAEALQGSTPFTSLPANVRELFERVVESMGLAD